MRGAGPGPRGRLPRVRLSPGVAGWRRAPGNAGHRTSSRAAWLRAA